MTQQWNPTGGGFDVEPLENINEFADLPDLAQFNEAQIYSIRSGEFAPDYVVPWAWDSSAGEYQEWRSVVDGHHYYESPFTIDDFEEDRLDANYRDIIKGEDFDYVTSPVAEGTRALRAQMSSDDNPLIISLPGDGLPGYFGPGEVLRHWYRKDSSGDSLSSHGQFFFGVQDAENYYSIRSRHNRGDSRLRVSKDGSSTVIDDADTAISADKWYIVQIEWGTDGFIEVKFMDENENTEITLSGTDTTFSEVSGIGFRMNLDPDNTAYWDHVQKARDESDFQ